MEMRKCKKCGEVKELVEFSVSRVNEDGVVKYRKVCRECRNSQRLVSWHKRHPKKEKSPVGEDDLRCCSSCQNRKELKEFRICKHRRKDGSIRINYSGKCKQCLQEERIVSELARHPEKALPIDSLSYKTCTKCGQSKLEVEFYKEIYPNSNYVWCKDCWKQHREKNHHEVEYYEGWHCVDPNCTKPLVISEVHRHRGIPQGHKGCCAKTESAKSNLRDKVSGKGNPFYGKHHPQEILDRIREKNKGRDEDKWKKTFCENCGIEFDVLINRAEKYGSKFHNRDCYNEYLEKNKIPRELYEQIRLSKEYRKWLKDIHKRDGHHCQDCGSNTNLEIHHIIHVFDIIKKYNIQTFKEAQACKILWDTNNGVTVCFPCHLKRHGKKIRTKNFNIDTTMKSNEKVA